MKKILLTIIILMQNIGCAEQYTDESLKKDKEIPTKQSKCILLEKYNLILDFTNLNKSGHYSLRTSLASDKSYWQGHDCQTNANENSKDFWCIGECDSGNIWVKIEEKNFKVKFEHIRLDTEFIKDGADDIESKYIDSKDTNYTQGIYVPCL